MGKSNISSYTVAGVASWQGDIHKKVKGVMKDETKLHCSIVEVVHFFNEKGWQGNKSIPEISITTACQRNGTEVTRVTFCPTKKCAETIVVEVNNYYQYLLRHWSEPMSYEEWRKAMNEKNKKKRT